MQKECWLVRLQGRDVRGSGRLGLGCLTLLVVPALMRSFLEHRLGFGKPVKGRADRRMIDGFLSRRWVAAVGFEVLHSFSTCD